jgi:uncharacterized protein YggE
MKKKILVLLIGLVALFALSACGSINDPNPQITASGTGTVYLNPDVAYVYIGVQTKSKDVGEALNENNVLANAINQKLQEMGVEAKDVQTSAFNIYPTPSEYGPNGEVVSNDYVVDNTVYVTVRDLQKLGDILDAVVRAGANSINGVTYDVLDKDTAYNEARQMAIDNAKKTANELSSAVGVKLGKLIYINVYSSGSAVPLYDVKGYGVGGGAGSVPTSSGQLVLTVTADLTYEIK